MLTEIPTVQEDTRLAEVISRFLEFGTRRLVVRDEQGRPLGLVSDAVAVTRVQPTARRGVLQALRSKSPLLMRIPLPHN
jgi:CBS domain-containing protein